MLTLNRQEPAATVNGFLTVAAGFSVRLVSNGRHPVPPAGFILMGRMGAPDDVTNVAEFFASELSGFVSGQLPSAWQDH